MVPISRSRTTAMAEAVDLMKNRGIGCVLVIDAGRLAGIVTERDVLLKVVGSRCSHHRDVGEVGTHFGGEDRLGSTTGVGVADEHLMVDLVGWYHPGFHVASWAARIVGYSRLLP